MSRKAESITLSISERDKIRLQGLAIELGMTWGDRPNITRLVEAIARRELQIAPNNDWSNTRIEALDCALDALTDAGRILEAQAIAQLLQERSELSIPLRNKIERFLETPPHPWRIELDRYILRQQPFQLSYQDATGRLWTFTVRHAQINRHEERQYLDCWCEETEGNLDIPKLMHNWCLRLDRIPEAAIFPIKGPWRPQLAQIAVKIHLCNRLAFAYKPKPGDISADWLENQVKQVVRRISSTYWFIREVKREAPDMMVIAPQSVRDRLRETFLGICQRYENS
ncbi:WYL domain-containing protein [Phormidium pseudopriestleyi FRX01]|uniref:WYL domain-containing protein n=1 Tax=Phormidium pseudopriestleyi FRX01 TaxID=1759528 RepID=A0ABS3FKS1_9CYAN|nr:WYL domain-containing protein [Phormidium pseudopriestleyi]MBO0347706.1 WYL domain-containing protein [Phormidium pseudopriestleyi FRX01]